jgi:tRNA-splicing endonuclease subunit Sen54
MHNALAFQRIHQPKHHTIATYHPESNMAYAYNPKGPLFTKMGQTLPLNEDPLGNERRGHRLWLLPEEALYLLERGTLDIRWPANDEEIAAGDMGLHMSATRSSLR